MQTIGQTLNESTRQQLLLVVLELILSYFAYGILTLSILITSAVLLFDYITIFGPELPSFLDYFSFLPKLFPSYFSFLSESSRGSSIHVDESDILGIYSLLAAIFWVLANLVRMLFSGIRRLLVRAPAPDTAQPQTPSARHLTMGCLRSLPRRLFLALLPTTVIFAIAFIAMPFTDQIAQGELISFYVVFVVFYVFAFVPIVLYILYSGFMQLMLSLVRSRLVVGQWGDET